jgi:hypothetical protein
MGTHTAQGEQNYLQIAQVVLPNDQVEPKKQDSVNNGGILVYFHILEMGGYGGVECRVNVIQKINHDGEVNR